jgi:multidrug resistance efflux pump
MRQKNLRLVVVGAVLIMAAVGFFLGMGTMAPKSNDAVALMQIVGQVSGVVGAIGLFMLIFGLAGRKASA